MTNTLQQVIDRVINHIAVEADTTTYNVNLRIIPKINEVIKQINKWNLKNILTDKVMQAWDLRYLRKKVYIKSVAPQGLQNSITPASTTINVNANNYSTTGYVSINNNVINYTGKSTVQLTWCTWIMGQFDKWDIIYQVYQKPSDLDRNFRLYAISRNLSENIEIPFRDYKYNKDISSYFTWIEDWSSDNQFLLIKDSIYIDYWLYYYRKTIKAVELTDIVDIPEDYWVELVALIVAWELLYETEQNKQAQWFLVEWYSKLHLFYMDQNSLVKEFRPTIKRQKATPFIY